MSQQFGYSNIHFPPAPVATVKLVATETHLATTDLNALLDTGADASFAPVELLESVQAGVGKIRYAHSLWGERQPFDSYIVDVQIGSITLPGITMLGYTGDEVILGRDVLNKLWVGLDGPTQMAEVSESRPKRKSTSGR